MGIKLIITLLLLVFDAGCIAASLTKYPFTAKAASRPPIGDLSVETGSGDTKDLDLENLGTYGVLCRQFQCAQTSPARSGLLDDVFD